MYRSKMFFIFTREHGVVLGVLGQVGLDLVAALERGSVASLVGHDVSWSFAW